MENKMPKLSKKVQLKITNILYLKEKLINWKNLDDIELETTIKQFEKIPRDEVSNAYIQYLKDPTLGQILVDISILHSDNLKLIANIISSLGYLIIRYKMEETDAIYELMLKYKKEKKESVGVIVSFFLRNLKRFEKFENQWKYYLSIKDLKPRDIAERTFVDLLEEKVRDIPLEYRKDIVSFLENSSKNKWYLNLIKEINSLC